MDGNPNNSLKRIKRELEDIRKNPIPGITFNISQDNLFEFDASLDGPPDSAYEEGRFKFHIKVPQDYPFKPPSVKAKTQIFHPNINNESVCVDILNGKWSPALKLQLVLISISSLLVDPCPEQGYPNLATYLMMSDKEQFNKVAREWVHKHALKEELVEEFNKNKIETAQQVKDNTSIKDIFQEAQLNHDNIYESDLGPYIQRMPQFHEIHENQIQLYLQGRYFADRGR